MLFITFHVFNIYVIAFTYCMHYSLSFLKEILVWQMLSQYIYQYYFELRKKSDLCSLDLFLNYLKVMC